MAARYLIELSPASPIFIAPLPRTGIYVYSCFEALIFITSDILTKIMNIKN